MGELDLAVTGAHGMEKLCVIKRVLPHLLVADNVQRFREEAAMVMRLSHGNLVGVLDAGREEGQFYLAMDFVEGKDLLATWNQCALRRVAFPVEIAAYVIKELARGLAYAHGYRDLNLVHRDISPANVLLSYSGEVKLTDFGLAISKLKEQQTAPGIIYGKLAYLAPEQARGQPLDQRTDLYAAGILLWEMLTGQQLFPSKGSAGDAPGSGRKNSTLDALERVRNPVVTAPAAVTGRVPPELNAIVMRALAAQPAERYQTGEEMRADLGSFLAQHAPATDAATLAAFMAVLFQEQIGEERADRDTLLTRASALLSGPIEPVAAMDRANTGAVTGHFSPLAQGSPSATTLQRRRQASDRRGRPPRPPIDGGERGLDAGAMVAPVNGGQVGAAPGMALGDEAGDLPADDQRVGTTIAGRYHLRRLCGEGAMGRVYEGHHVEIGRRVAIKILHSNFRNTADVVERFRREARAASRIGHPNIVDVTDSGTTSDGAFFFVMEYLDGVDLEQLIKREGPLAVERALLIAAQVCRALIAAHAAGIIHRDLKPANVMLVRQRDEEDFVKVLDFGISKQSELDIDPRGKDVGLTRPDAAVGTPIYMAPEQVAGRPADGRTDVYAVGELLFEMLTATAPCAGSDIIAVFNKKATEDPPPVRTLRADVPAPVERMLAQSMSRQPAARQASMTELKDEIMRCLTRIEAAPMAPLSSARTQLADGTTGRVWRGGPRVLWIIALGVLAGVGLASAVLLRSTDGGRSIVPPPGNAGTPAGAQRLLSPAAPARPTSGPLVAPATQSPAAPPGPRVATSPAANPPPAGTPPMPAGSSGGAAPIAAAPPSRPTSDGSLHPRSARVGASLPRGRATASAIPGRSAGRALGTPRTGSAPPASGAAAQISAADTLTRGRAAFAKGSFPEAVRLARATTAAGDGVGGHLLLGDAFYKMERFADARAEYDAVLKLEPANERARRGRDLASRRK